jgi:hypothetical protein
MKQKKHAVKGFLRDCFCALPMSDKWFNEILFRRYLKQPLHLDPPITFNEKIQWLKLFRSSPFYASLVDKYTVRNYVQSKVGAKYLNEIYGVFSSATDIDFNKLPEKFALKATHGSGWNIFCSDKSLLDMASTRTQLQKWLNMNFYRFSREPNYRAIPPRILCEHFLESDESFGLLDFKFFCFHGHVEVIQVDFDRYTNHTRNMYDREWSLYPFTYIYANHATGIKRPENLDEMIQTAETLAGKIPFVRVDLYNLKSRILFGEMTFTPESGFGIIRPVEWDFRLGAYLDTSQQGTV